MGDATAEAERRVTALVFMKHHSERVPRKNFREVGGRPLYEWIFEALSGCRFVERMVLNTDSSELAELVTSRFEVTVHMRPGYLLTINTNEANQILAYDIGLLGDKDYLQVHSTTPLLSSNTLDSVVEDYFTKALPGGYDSLFTVTPHRKRFFTADGLPVNHDPRVLVKTQELSPLLEENSCAYVFSRTSFLANGSNRVGLRPFLREMDATEAVDIDTESELRLADSLLRERATARGAK